MVELEKRRVVENRGGVSRHVTLISTTFFLDFSAKFRRECRLNNCLNYMLNNTDRNGGMSSVEMRIGLS